MTKELNAYKWLNENKLSYDIWSKKYRYKEESFEGWLDRVSGGNSEIKRLIREKKFLFGGRTLANRGVENGGSFSNCYSIGFVPDSLDGIMDAATKIAMTFKAQGGQGLSLSKIRPKGASINNGQFASDGIVPFMHIFNTVTESISQGGCIFEDELVLTDKGLIPIKNINIGDKVWTKQGYVSVNYKWNKGFSDIYQVKLKSGLTIKTTLDHKFNIDGFNGIPLKDLKIGDKVVIILGDTSNNNIFDTSAYVLGTFLANGTINKKRNGGNITFSSNIPTGRTIVSPYLEKLTGDNISIYEDKSFYRVALSKKAIELLNYEKNGTEYIKIPDFILNSSTDIRLSFIAGLLDTDGCVYKNSFKYNTISEDFAKQLTVLLNSVGFFPKLTIQYRENRKPLYEVYTSVYSNSPYIPSYKFRNNIKDYVKNCRNNTPFTIENLGITNRTGHLKKLSKSNNIGFYTYLKECMDYYKPCILEEIISIDPIGQGKVYDISLESEHFFSCNGFYVSNSRKGALLMSIDAWHPEAETFIRIKEDPNEINKANLSVEIDNEFMDKVTMDTDVSSKRAVYAQKIFNAICESAWKSAEPGILFVDKFRNYNLMEFVDNYQIEVSNPCGR